MIEFVYNDVRYKADWTDGYVRLPNGNYLIADWRDGKPENISQRKLFVAPKQYAQAEEAK